MSLLSRTGRLAGGALGVLSALMGLAAVVLTCLEAGIRYFAPHLAVDWGTEVIIYLLVWAVFLTAAQTALEDRHVAATLVVDLMPRPLRSAAFLGAILIGLGFGAVLLIYGWRVVEFSARLNITGDSSLRFPLAWYYMILPVAGGLLCLGYLIRLWRFVVEADARVPRKHDAMDGSDP